MQSPTQAPRAQGKDIFQVKSSGDPSGTGMVGHSSGYDLEKTAACHPVIYYKGRHGEHFITADYYEQTGAPSYLVVYCPVCKNALTIKADHKHLELEKDAVPRFPGYSAPEVLLGLGLESLGGSLSVERFGCTWEETPDLHRAGGVNGFSVCSWKVVIDRSIARDA